MTATASLCDLSGSGTASVENVDFQVRSSWTRRCYKSGADDVAVDVPFVAFCRALKIDVPHDHKQR